MKKSNKKSENEKIRYKSFAFRMSEQTLEGLKEERAKSGKTWNRFFVDIIKKQK